ncbi:MAG: type transport system ATP-binding protein [Solirubrobacteraceae bacterium]|nr:type transport system ATP-binding protein [Solirubrobacteraceae bacterium]
MAVPSVAPSAILVDDVCKTFRLPHEQMHTLKERALHPFRRTGSDAFRALSNVSFSVEPGEFFGIVGRNGSGKSTLLKCMAGIYRVDTGLVYVNGRLSTFIELGVGFNPDLAAYDNAMLNAAMLGLTTREARRRFDRIIDFAELREFAELKIKNYSSGMLVRLAFSVMIQVDADILLIDEVLAVGDAAFQQKCFDEFARIRRSGTTVVLVTHDMSAVERFCDRGMLLERGRAAEIGDTEHVAARYLELNFSSDARAAVAASDPDEADDELAPSVAPDTAADGAGEDDETLRLGDRRAEIVDCWFEDLGGGRVEAIPTHETFAVAFRVRFHEDIDDPAIGVELHNSDGRLVLGATNRKAGSAGSFPAGTEAVFHFEIENVLAPNRYWATAAIAPDANAMYWHDRRARVASAVVTGTIDGDWILDVPATFSITERDRGASELRS